MKKKLTAMVLALGAIFGTFEAGAALAGSGTKADPYRIGSYGDLVAFAAKVNGGETTAWAVLTADITATAADWMPIGSYETENRLHHVEYKGVFDGQGHTIANLSNAGFTDEKRGRGGLFYSLGSGGIVKNVQLTNVNVSSSNSVGAVVDNCNPGSTVENCEVSGSVSGNNIVGGVVSYALAGTVVKNCRAACTVTGGNVGGVVGMTYGNVENCEAECTVNGIRGDPVGGIVGLVNPGSAVSGCKANCTLNGRGYVGGIVGHGYGFTLTDCSASGTFVGTYVGGIIGYCSSTTVNVCRASCDVTYTGTDSFVGGIVGRVDSGYIVANCEASGKVTGGPNAYAGGIIGQANDCAMENCSSSCTVVGGSQSGGIAGQDYRGPIRNCYNTGSVTSTGTGEYDMASGGIVGNNFFSVVENCYNTGAVSGTNSRTGGIVGWNYGDSYGEDEAAKVLHSYALAGIAGGKLVGENYSLSVVTDVRALSAAEFRVQSNFTGWDFDEVWKMGENAPKLRTNYDVTYDENWAGGGTTTKELFKGDGILANAPADPKREGWYFCGWFTESEGGLKVTGATVADGDATYYAQWGKPVATFAAGAVSSSESKTVKLTVFGGSLTGPSSVKVFMTYQTAAAADLDFANATINGVKVKGGLKFPLTLSWDTADVTPYTIEIPLKGDKAVEDDETVTFQLADVIGTEMGETDVCTVTVEDPAFDELRGRIETGTATKAESNTWIKVSHDGIPYMRGLAYPADGGKVTGSAYCPENKKVTLKATANKGFTFLGWTTNAARSVIAPYPDGYFVATTPSLVIDRTAKPAASSNTSTTLTGITESTTFYAVFEGDPRVTATPVAFDETKGLFVASDGGKVTGAGRYAPGKKVTLKATANKGYAFSRWEKAGNGELGTGNGLSQSASYTFEMTNEDVDLYAVFVTVEEDAVSIAAGLNGGGILPPSEEEPVSLATNVMAGVYLEWSIAADALSQTTVKVAGLPSGLKFTAKDIVDSKTKQVTVPANTIYGAPTAASKMDKNGKPVPSKVKVTVTTAGKSSVTYAIALTVDALPAWAVGSFDGAVGAQPNGTVALTIATSGKISGKILEGGRTWSLSAAYFERAEGLDSLDNLVFHATVIAKAGKEVATNVVSVVAEDGVGVATGTFDAQLSTLNSQLSTYTWTAYQNLWKRADTKASQPVFKKNIVVEYYPLGVSGDKNNTVKFTFKKDGAVSFSGKVGGVSVSGSAQLVLVGRDDPIAPLYQMTIYAPPKPTAKPPFVGWCETFPVKLTMDEQNIVTKVEIDEEHEMVQLWEGGPYWATTNIGAKKPEDSGYYFWWGDTLGYKWENEQWVASDGSVSGFSFEESNGPTSNKDVATLQSEGWITSGGVLAPAHDAAHVQWGGDWRMPTYQELYDLCNDKCDWTWTTMNGMEGYIVCGKGAYASNSIFLPCAGLGDGTSLYTLFSTGSYGLYWSSAPCPDNYSAKRLDFGPSYHNNMSYNGRDCGFSIRPVQSPAE